MVYIFLADGFEEIEALTPVDILRRGGLKVLTVGAEGKSAVGAHEISVQADIEISRVDLTLMSCIILPGGGEGTERLWKNEKVKDILRFAIDNEILIGAICAAPSILGREGYLKGKRAVCYPGFEKYLDGADAAQEQVVKDGRIITARAAGAAAEFAFTLLEELSDKQTAQEVRAAMYYG